MSFGSQIAAWAKKTKADRDQVVTQVFKSVGTAVINRTPIGDWSEWQKKPSDNFRATYRPGTLANSWFAGLGDHTESQVRDPNPTAVGSLQSIDQVASTVSGNIGYIVNPAPYARRIEYGHSNQAPSGMVRVTVAEFADIVKAEVLNVTG